MNLNPAVQTTEDTENTEKKRVGDYRALTDG
jgi:hypothetical protein